MIHAREDYQRIQDPECLIPADEPVFLLRAQDACAAVAVDAWANAAELSGASREIVASARKQAERMRLWPKHQTPDMPNDPF